VANAALDTAQSTRGNYRGRVQHGMDALNVVERAAL
jgi:hypothetical protein